MEQPTQTFRRNPFEILGECFTIYGRRFRELILIALIIQIPLTILEFAISDSLPDMETLAALQINLGGDPRAFLPPDAAYGEEPLKLPEALSGDEIARLVASMTGYLIATALLYTLLSGVIAYAIGMQYAVGRLDVGRSYSRAWWRVLTLAALGLLSFGILALMVVGLVLLIVPGLIMLTLMVYWSVAVQTAIIEGCKPIEAFRRSFRLVQGNWWRTFAAWILIVLVISGLGILLELMTVPIALTSETEGILWRLANAIISLLGDAIVAPISAIAGALIYLDLRARKENYDLDALTEQLNVSRGSNGSNGI